MAQYPYDLVEAFAAAPLQGNLLPVIHDADAVATATMQVIAGRFHLSETSFLQTAPEPHQTYRHRIFLVTREIPFAGHPSIGSAAAWAKRRGLETAEIVQLTGTGEQRLHVEVHGRSASVDLWQDEAVFGPQLDALPITRAIGFSEDAVHPTLTPQVVSTGFPTSIVPIADYRLLAEVSIDWRALDAALTTDPNSEPTNFYLVGEVAPGHWRARMFGEDIPGGEDAATGSAAGPLGAYLDRYTGLKSLVIDQGIEMRSPSRLRVRTDHGIVVSGDVQFLAEGTITID